MRKLLYTFALTFIPFVAQAQCTPEEVEQEKVKDGIVARAFETMGNKAHEVADLIKQKWKGEEDSEEVILPELVDPETLVDDKGVTEDTTIINEQEETSIAKK